MSNATFIIGSTGGQINFSKVTTPDTPPAGYVGLYAIDNTILTIDSNGNQIPFAAGATGAAGSSGTSGVNGSSGTSGSVGATGSSGTSGVNGSSGTSGAVGATGSSGTSGIDGSVGATGSSGTSGVNGSSGTSGDVGAAGSSGTSGVNGSSGTSGDVGAAGSSGTSGVNGSNGTSGVNGAAGSAGTSGTSFSSPYSGNLNGTAGQSWMSAFGSTTSIDWNNGNVQTHTLTASTTFTFANPQNGATYIVLVRQAAAGNYTVTWPTVSWSGANTPIMTATGNRYDVYTFIYANNQYYGSAVQNFT
jgi:hypothetical protein